MSHLGEKHSFGYYVSLILLTVFFYNLVLRMWNVHCELSDFVAMDKQPAAHLKFASKCHF